MSITKNCEIGFNYNMIVIKVSIFNSYALHGNHPNKHLCILVPAILFLYLVPYLRQFSAVEYRSAENYIWCYFKADLAS